MKFAETEQKRAPNICVYNRCKSNACLLSFFLLSKVCFLISSISILKRFGRGKRFLLFRFFY